MDGQWACPGASFPQWLHSSTGEVTAIITDWRAEHSRGAEGQGSRGAGGQGRSLTQQGVVGVCLLQPSPKAPEPGAQQVAWESQL